MKKIITQYASLVALLLVLFTSCTEPYALQTNNYEEAIVIEATITNELKNQEIKVSKTFRFEDNGPTLVDNAVVNVTDSDGTVFEFEFTDGRYVSVNQFQAISGKQYKLLVVTDNGKSYTSTAETLTTVSPILDVVPTVLFKEGKRGVGLNVKSFDPTNTSKYYRYDYEETYKIIAPKWNAQKAVIIPGVPNASFEMVNRTTEAKTCYSSQKSNSILLYSTNNLSQDNVDFQVRFISDKNYIISHRYSILVNQYVQNLASYTFYKTLSDISGSGSILSQNQPGFFFGNIKCVENPAEKVIGFFDVSSKSTKRIFFNYADLFPNEPLPPYYISCPETEIKYCFNTSDPDCNGFQVNSSILSNTALVYLVNSPTVVMVDPPCGDCTTFSSNIIPSFWID